MSNDFDWTIGGLTEDFWRRAAQACTYKPSEAQLRMACCLHAGLNQSDSARRSGYVGNDVTIRQQGHKAAKSTSVNELLAYAKAETGTGDDGMVSPKEARRILSRIARRGDHRARIAALESLAKLDRDEAAANAKPEESIEEQIADIIIILPESAAGAFLALSCFHSNRQNIVNFPYLKECAPVVAKTYPKEWAGWRSKHREQWHPFLDGMAAGPVLEPDALSAAVKAKLPTRPVNPAVEAGEA
jgi:hypothetical protein